MKKLIVMIVIMMIISPIPIYGKSESGETIIRFYLTANNKYSYEVIVGSNGCLKDGSQEIRDGKIVYNLSIGQEKKFKVQADIGYEIEYIKYNNKEMKGIKDEVIIKGVSENRKLEVKFKKKEIKINKNEGGAGIANNTDNKPDTKGNASQIVDKKEVSRVETGDITSLKGYVAIILGAIGVLTLIKKKHIKHQKV